MPDRYAACFGWTGIFVGSERLGHEQWVTLGQGRHTKTYRKHRNPLNETLGSGVALEFALCLVDFGGHRFHFLQRGFELVVFSFILGRKPNDFLEGRCSDLRSFQKHGLTTYREEKRITTDALNRLRAIKRASQLLPPQ
jgi:hypothetical protein